MFDLVEDAFDQVAFLAERPVDGMSGRSRRVLLELSDCSEITRIEPAEVIGVTGRVRHDMAGTGQPVDQPLRLRAIAPLAGRDRSADRHPKRIGRRLLVTSSNRGL